MKRILILIVTLAALSILAGCQTYDLTKNKVGASNFADIAVKDFVVMGIINLESQEVSEYGPLGIHKIYRGSRIVWSDLMAEAARMGADDIINVRIEETNYNFKRPSFIDYLAGYTSTWKYKATALAIKYTDPIDRQKSGRADNLRGQDY